MGYVLLGMVLYLYIFTLRDKRKIHRTRQKTVRILKYITRIIQEKDKKAEKENQ